MIYDYLHAAKITTSTAKDKERIKEKLGASYMPLRDHHHDKATYINARTHVPSHGIPPLMKKNHEHRLNVHLAKRKWL